MSIWDLRQRNVADKVAGKCRGDIGIYTDSSCLLMDVAVGEATPLHPHISHLLRISRPRQMSPRTLRRRPRKCHRRDDADQDSSSLRLPGQSFAIEHQIQVLRAIRVGSFWLTWNRGGSLSGAPITFRFCVFAPSSVSSPLRIMCGWHSDGYVISDTRFRVLGLLPHQTFAHAIC